MFRSIGMTSLMLALLAFSISAQSVTNLTGEITVLTHPDQVGGTVIDFENLSVGDPISLQYSAVGVVFNSPYFIGTSSLTRVFPPLGNQLLSWEDETGGQQQGGGGTPQPTDPGGEPAPAPEPAGGTEAQQPPQPGTAQPVEAMSAQVVSNSGRKGDSKPKKPILDWSFPHGIEKIGFEIINDEDYELSEYISFQDAAQDSFASALVTIPAHGAVWVGFTLGFKANEVRSSATDFKFDNLRFASSRRIVFGGLDTTRSDEGFDPSAFPILAQAFLDPSLFGEQGAVNLKPEFASTPLSVVDADSLLGLDVIVVTDSVVLTASEKIALTNFVVQGGCVLMFLSHLGAPNADNWGLTALADTSYGSAFSLPLHPISQGPFGVAEAPVRKRGTTGLSLGNSWVSVVETDDAVPFVAAINARVLGPQSGSVVCLPYAAWIGNSKGKGGTTTTGEIESFVANLIGWTADNAFDNSNPAPTCEGPDDIVVDVGTAIHLTIQADDATGEPLVVSAAALPPGSTLSPLSGSGSLTVDFFWTPTVNDVGVRVIRVSFADIVGQSISCEFAITVVNLPPACGSTEHTFALAIGEDFSLQITGSDPNPGEVLTVSSSGLPMGATLSPQSGPAPLVSTLNWLPTISQVGQHDVTITYTDLAGDDVSCTLSLIVVNTVPECSGPDTATVAEGQSIGLEFVGHDSNPGDTLSVTTDGLPTGASLTTAALGDDLVATLDWTPATDQIGHHTVTLTFTDSFGESTACQVNVLVLDITNPVVTIQAPIDGAIVGATTVSVTALIEDNAPTQVTSEPIGLGGNSVAPSDLTIGTVQLPFEGENVIRVSSTDSSGNSGGASIMVIRDTTPPVINITAPADGAVFGMAPVGINVSIEDLTATTVTIGSNQYALDAGTNVVTSSVPLVEGANTVTVTATDVVGNTATVTLNLTLDLTAPVVTIDSPLNGAFFGPAEAFIPVTATVADLSATMANSNPTGVSGQLPAGGGILTGAVALVEGENAILVSATDDVNLTGSDSILVFLDTTAPEIAITSPEDGDWVSGSIDFDAIVADPDPGVGLGSVVLRANGQDIASTETAGSWEGAFDSTELADGVYVLEVIATDALGNTSTLSVTVNVDNTAPVITITSPADGAIVGGIMDFDVTATDAASGVISLRQGAGDFAPTTDGSMILEVAQATFSITGSEDTSRHPDGMLALTAFAMDAAGNTSETTIFVTVDNTAPVKTILSPSQGQVVRGTVMIEVDVIGEPNLDTVEIRVDGQSQLITTTPTCTLPFDTTTRLDGRMVITVIAKDLVGNVSSCSLNVHVNNLKVSIHPSTLNLKSRGGSRSVTVIVEGPSVGLLMPVSAHDLELLVPGGNNVSATTGNCWNSSVGDHNCNGVPDIVVKFDRKALISSLRAGTDQRTKSVRLRLRADGAFILGSDKISLKGQTKCGRR